MAVACSLYYIPAFPLYRSLVAVGHYKGSLVLICAYSVTVAYLEIYKPIIHKSLQAVISTWIEFSRLLLGLPPGLSRATAVRV